MLAVVPKLSEPQPEPTEEELKTLKQPVGGACKVYLSQISSWFKFLPPRFIVVNFFLCCREM